MGLVRLGDGFERFQANEHEVQLNLDYIQPPKELARWDDLVLPSGHKEIIQAMVEMHTSRSQLTTLGVSEKYDADVVRDKGNDTSL